MHFRTDPLGSCYLSQNDNTFNVKRTENANIMPKCSMAKFMLNDYLANIIAH